MVSPVKRLVKGFLKKALEKTPYRVIHHARFEKFEARLEKLESKLPKPTEPLVSLVVASYNVAPYIERFLASVFGQTMLPDGLEVILVNDGSTDRTGEIIDDWQARYPVNIRVVHQENGGISAARNAGLALATGTWISFPDPDDFLDVEFFKHMMAEISRKQTRPLVAVVSNMVFYDENRDQFSDTHPLRHRFAKPVTRLSSDNLKDFMQLSASTAWFRRETVVQNGITFDARIVTAAEDMHFVNSVLMSAPLRTVSFLKRPIYFNRKRVGDLLVSERDMTDPSWFSDQIEFGSLDLLKKSRARFGKVPYHLQRTVLYSTFLRFRYLVDHPERTSFLNDDQRQTFWRLLQEVIDYIDAEIIERFNLAGCTEEHKTALLALFKGQRRSQTPVYLEQVDPDAGMVQFSHFTGGDDSFDLRCLVNGVEAASFLPSRRAAHFLDKVYYRQHFFWLKLRDGDDVAFEREGEPCLIRRKAKTLGKSADWLTLRNAEKPTAPANLNETIKRLRAHVLAQREVYRGAMVLMDREDKADDNAEHLYRHLIATGRAEKAWFILSPDSPDWPRLEAEGFKLLPFRSREHIAAHLNADFVLSSHAPKLIVWPVERSNFADIARFQFIFLQHGVLLTDIAPWINTKPIRLFVTTTPSEYQDVTRQNGDYIFTEREALHSGLPRHDALWAKGQLNKGDSILIIPTWRRYLTAPQEAEQLRRGKVDDFFDSKYAKSWQSFLKSPRLREIANEHGLRIVFAPHPNIAIYLAEMDLPEHIEVVNVLENVSYQDVLVKARLAVTCYSSAATEVAFLQRPLVYFQFDADEFFGGNHSVRKGYFSFEEDGFGPVTTTVDDALNRIEEALEGREDPAYASRRDAAFPFRDGQCCERVYQAIERIRRK